MAKWGILLFICCQAVLLSCNRGNTDQDPIRKTEKFTGEWKFILGDVDDAWKAEFLVPFADTPVSITIEGDATIAGVDNGNQTSHHDFQGNTINAFHGKCLAIIRSGNSTGTVKVTFESEGLPAETLVLTMN
jgi:hypothetical protein